MEFMDCFSYCDPLHFFVGSWTSLGAPLSADVLEGRYLEVLAANAFDCLSLMNCTITKW